MWIVELALKRPYTFIVMALLIVILGVTSIFGMATDIFPAINIPVVSVVWSYQGMSPEEVANRIVSYAERSSTTTVNDIEHIESQSLQGVGVIKIFFQPSARIEAAVAQVTAIMQTIVRVMPAGMTPPLVIAYNASSVPILQLGLESPTLTEQQLFDLGLNSVRLGLATVQGASIPLPFGGKQRQMMVDLDPNLLLAKGLTPFDVSTALNNQNLVLPAGTAKMGAFEYNVRLNASSDAIDDLNRFPVKETNGGMVYIGDVATVHDGFAPQVSLVEINGRKSALLTILKSGNASTLDIVNRVKARLPEVLKAIPPPLGPQLQVRARFDQSVFVRAAVDGVLREAVIAACLTAAMILLFLGSWRETTIVAISIPLAILASIVCLGFLGETLNVMTLGGLALAVGILVDDATVAIENIHRYVEMGKGVQEAILLGSEEIAVPTFVSTLSICVVFVSVVFLTGPARFLFTPLALAVVFAMMASYVLSRTLVPVLAQMFLPADIAEHGARHHRRSLQSRITPIHERFNRAFETFRRHYTDLLEHALHHRRQVLYVFLGFIAWTGCLLPFVGRDFFPSVDAGMLRLHVRAPAGMRIEETARRFHEVSEVVRQVIPAGELDMLLANIGLPQGGVNLAFSDSASIGPNDGELLISLKPEHRSTDVYMKLLRTRLPARFPDTSFFFQPADIVNQILNFGLPAPIDIQVTGNDPRNFQTARLIAERVRGVPGAVDVHVHQVLDAPDIRVDVDRSRAQTMGMTQRDVASNLLVSLTGSAQGSPNFWVDPKTGVSYQVAVMTPQYRIHDMNDLLNTSVLTGSADRTQQQLSNVAAVSRGRSAQNVSHYNVQPVYDIYAGVQDRDLGGVSTDIERILADVRKQLPKDQRALITVRGQVQSMNQSFTRLGMGIVFAIVFVYLLMVVNFQSWLDPFIIITALPGALCGVVWMLFVTQTTFSVPSLMGTIMCLGVATANSILMVTFANERLDEGHDAIEAALMAGHTRLRPVLMTALAMIIGMLPMALGFGEGGEQNAPLGRAVIGGLLVATATTLLFVPVVYSVLRRRPADGQQAQATTK